MTETFAKSPGWLDWDSDIGSPNFDLPHGAVDSHCHVFGPSAEFPFAPERKYTPCDAGKHDLRNLRRALGVSRSVIVQATCHGRDNSAMLDALDFFGETARGVATVGPDIGHEDLESMHRRGVRGVRFNFLKRLVAEDPSEDLLAVAAKIKEFGWHVVLYFEPDALPDIEPLLARIDVPVVIDHMGRPDVSSAPTSREFGRFLELVDRYEAWVKISCPERLTKTDPCAERGAKSLYDDVVPFARKVVEEFPERVLWGTDWPHPNLKTHMPNDAVLLDYIPRVAESEEARRALLVDNPMTLYWPGHASRRHEEGGAAS